jgi:hypothetical protein
LFADDEKSSPTISSLPPLACQSPIWNTDIRAAVTDSKLPDYQLAALRQSLLVPGTEATSKDIKTAAKVPVLLLQTPGSHDESVKKLGNLSWMMGGIFT